VLVLGATVRAEYPAMRAIRGSVDHRWGQAMAAFRGEAERAPPVHRPAAQPPYPRTPPEQPEGLGLGHALVTGPA
jgi:hypothetical protein